MTGLEKAWILTQKELKQFFVSPIAYVVMMIFLTLSGYFFYVYMVQFSMQYQNYKNMVQFYKNPEILAQFNLNQMVIAPALYNMMFVFLFILPLIMMRSFSEEMKQKTDQLLITSPITSGELIMGKFFGSFFFVMIMLLPTVAYEGLLFYFSSPETGPIATGYFGLMLFVAAGISIGLFASSLTENQIIAAVITFVILLFMFVINMVTVAEGSWVYKILQYISVSDHIRNPLQGMLDTRDVVYFGSLIFLFLFMTKRSLEAKGWR
ncbi:MAG: ABC transporter permease subunit [Bdellovibrionota bacterium]